MLKYSSEKLSAIWEKNPQNAFASPALCRKSFKNTSFKWRLIISLPGAPCSEHGTEVQFRLHICLVSWGAYVEI